MSRYSADGVNWVELSRHFESCVPRGFERHEHHPDGWGHADELIPRPVIYDGRGAWDLDGDYVAQWYDIVRRRTVIEARVGGRVGQVVITDEEAWRSGSADERPDVFLRRQNELVERLMKAAEELLPWQREVHVDAELTDVMLTYTEP